MWDFSFLRALVVWAKLGPLLLVRLAAFTAVAVVLGCAIALGIWLEGRLALIRGTADAVLGGLAGAGLAAVLLAIFGRGIRQTLQIRMIV